MHVLELLGIPRNSNFSRNSFRKGSLLLNSELFSTYKNHTTLKGLVGISPSGAITFISQLHRGSMSDREIVERSGILDLPFTEGDSVMADKGFTISDILPLGMS